MLIIYKSYNFQDLIEKACTIFTKFPLPHPLQHEIFITKNKNIDHWIKIFIAKKYSISSNIKFLRFQKFVWKIYRYFNSNYYSKLEFEKYYLIWKMMNIKNINELTNFIGNNTSQIKLFEIISYLSKKFEEYLSYRPDWIKEWETNLKQLKDEHLLINKYKLIWTQLLKHTKNKHQSILNYSNLLFFLEKKIQKKKNIKIQKFPSRIFIFGNQHLKPFNMIFLKIISKICTIHFFYITPYKNETKILLDKIKFKQHELTLIKNNTSCFFKATQTYKTILENIFNKKNNTNETMLLGKYGCEYAVLLHLIKKKEINIFNFKKPTCLLQEIQKKIINTQIKPSYDINKIQSNKETYEKDQSISIHVCSTIKREIEVLHENLLNVFNTYHDILFNDVLIISANINLYIPFIYSTFNSFNPKHYIPFCILSNFDKKKETILNTTIKILDLPYNSLDNENIFTFLENSFILKKFEIEEKEINILHKIIKKSQINFEVTRNSSKFQFKKNNQECILNNGEKRIFLGQAINDKNYTIWNENVPYNFSNTKHFDIFNKLIKLIILLRKWKKILSTSKCLKSWKLIFEELLNNFFNNNKKEQKEISFIKKQWNSIIQPGILENYKKRVSIKLLKNELLKSSSKKENTHDLFSGKITFCNKFILRGIPFKVIYILGMNELFSKKKIFHENFDLINKYPRICDPNRKDEDEYLFLKTLLSAQKVLIMSYYKNSENKEKHKPSCIIHKLSLYISKNFNIFNIRKKNKHDNDRNKLSYDLYHYHTKIPYQIDNFIEKSNYQNFNKTWLKISRLQKQPNKNILKPLKKIECKNVNITSLISFWKNPIQNFFNKRLHIKLNPIEVHDLKKENFQINKLNNYTINLNIIDFLLKKKDTKKLFLYFKSKNIIPHGCLGEIYWENQISSLEPLCKKINTIKTKLIDKKFCFKIKKHTVYGTLKNINETGLLRWKPNFITNKDMISLWLEHLICCSIFKTSYSIMLSPKNKSLIFLKIKKKRANDLLNKYIIGYLNGMQNPLLLTNSGIIWLNSVYNKKSQTISKNIEILKTSRKKMMNVWEGNNWIQGEKHNLYLKKIIYTLDKKIESKICNVAKKWILPILRHIK